MRADLLERARGVRLEDEIAHRGIKLRRQGSELIGPCPRCGGADRFGINIRKQVFNCRGCGASGGDTIALVRFLDPASLEVEKVVDAAIGLVRTIEKVIKGDDRALTWLYDRNSDGTFPDAVFA